MFGPIFFAVEVACERLNGMLGARKIRVCSLVYSGVEICLLLAILSWLFFIAHQDYFETAATDFNIEGRLQFSARSSMFASGLASARLSQSENSD